MCKVGVRKGEPICKYEILISFAGVNTPSQIKCTLYSDGARALLFL